ncbi:hypothetical protein CBI38_27775 [Rhodococcus oxybenzonivorans]|uniref:ANTAR domain-containing protein n=1 Tax=Rhodococcus oxybenzonivorans TaxID=1990687 RepID=A0A2S2C1M9_9NOCA|nr:GAF and ANTAR domain-containing protein [Rhodococcus oxybenzonivorans]AWK74791.1 hypothetical protein CBI38_27775 [Rhodococcus oxybenzonivorans]
MNGSGSGGIVRTMADLARSFSAPRSVEDSLSTVTAAAVDLMPTEACAGILMVSGGGKKFDSVAATSDLLPKLDHVQEELGEGPCVAAAVANLVVRCDDFRSDDRWPRFAAAAVDVGIYSSISFQLYTSEGKMGALNLFAFEPHAFGLQEESMAEVLAAHAALALMAARTKEQLQSALVSRDVIGQAKGMIMERFNVDAIRAFEMLTHLSQETNTRLHAVAEQIVERGK